MTRRVVLLFLAAFLLIGSAGQAQAAGYRYWSFWDRDGDSWVYATQGPSLVRPSDGDVQGFRFAVSENSGDAAQPRGTADFAAICAKTPAEDGSKRVALVLDFGTASDAPSGETPPASRTACAQVSPAATTADALAAVADPLRYNTNALLCGIAGYPKSGCGEQVARNEGSQDAGSQEESTATAAPDEKSTQDDNGPSVGLYAGIALVAALAGAAAWQARRRGNATD
ncbi:SCO2322 family protein [Streptomyces sp. NPDC017230]|uniref:SCO2322 family protein n=1 Tax=unclassified Streptomyces TaxID=2593676 RepID=UPI00379AE546